MVFPLDEAVRMAMQAILRLTGATLGQCEAVDLVATEDDAVATRCTNTGVRIREDMGGGRLRHRTVCPRHGYDPDHTPPLQAHEL